MIDEAMDQISGTGRNDDFHPRDDFEQSEVARDSSSLNEALPQSSSPIGNLEA